MKVEVTILVLDKAGFRGRKIMCIFNRASKYMMRKWIVPEEDTDKSTISIREFKTPLLVINRSSRQKVNNDIVELNHTSSQRDLIVICRVFHPTIAEYTFFSSSMEHSPRWTTFMGHKTDLNKTYKNINYISMLSEHSRIRLKKSIAERYL